MNEQPIDYRKHRVTAGVGDDIIIPTTAVGITLADLSMFGDTVQVSWLEPVDGPDHAYENTFRVYAERTEYTDETPVSLPGYAVTPRLYEDPDSTESVVYWLA